MKNYNKIIRLAFLAVLLVFIQCKNASENESEQEESKMEEKGFSVKTESFGETSNGEAVEKYIISNDEGLEMAVITYGGIITSLKVPNKEGEYEDVVLGLDSLSLYEEKNPYFGAIIGRYGNRIAKGKFSLDGTEYVLETNDGENHLHGGEKGFDKVVWDAEVTEAEDSVSL
ncbi:MAG: galactose-1-epimerase, partial [Christiangramia sp.]|nr:galactose-1-epimerase [Christiangramia sp.]